MTASEDPQSVRSLTFSRKIQRGLLILLSLYWLVLFTGTHIPVVPQAIAEQGDKFLHLVAYGGLAVLLLAWRISKGSVAFGTVAMIWLVIAGYGIFDETSQLLVGRFCDLNDWIADVIGTTVGLAVTWLAASLLIKLVNDRKSKDHSDLKR